MQALNIITDAFERCNRLSPGETLSADDAAFGFRRLNMLVDELSANNQFLFKSVLTSAAQTGPITLGAGAWAAIVPGDEIISATANNLTLAPISMRQYNELYAPAVTGMPTVWAQDGLGTVYLWPTPNGQTIKLQTRTGVSAFADQTTEYTLPDGYAAALGAGLAVRIAPSILGNIPPYLLQAERKCMGVVSRYEPAIIGVDSFTKGRGYFPPRLF
jgi:hypothetical protein